jgi:hypothetical protein
MEIHSLLYVDVLGFAELTKSNPAKVEDIFRVITQMRKRNESVYDILIFSDTILIKNRGTPATLDEQMFCVQWLYEFAVDLQYQLSQLDVFYRAVLINGPFNSYKQDGVDCFYGQALIDAYKKEKKIKCAGLFIDKSTEELHGGFPCIRHSDDLAFAYTSDSLEEHSKFSGGLVALDKFVLEETDSCWLLSYDVKYLSQLFKHGHTHPNPDVRIKFLAAFDYYEQRYPNLVRALIDSEFDVSIICKDYDWSQQVYYSSETT